VGRRNSVSKSKDGDAANKDPAEAFYAALGECISKWTNIEYAVESLLNACLPKAEHNVIAAVFASVDNFRTQARMVDAALKVALEGHSSLLTEWSALLKRLGQKQTLRNKFAHGTVQFLFAESGEHQIYITRSLLDPDQRQFDPPDPRHGYSLRDLKNFQRDVETLRHDLRSFRERLDEPVAQFERASSQKRRMMYKRVLKTLKGADP
jgi:hypothetical protein